MPNNNEGLQGPEQPVESVPTPEAAPSPEAEKTPETESSVGQEKGDTAEMSQEPAPQLQQQAAPIPVKEQSRDPLLIEVEGKLSDGLWDAYKSMHPAQRSKFKAEGERVAAYARDGIKAGKLAAEKLLDMIVNWLRMIPRVDRWFLVQDAKIKTDALMRMAENKDENL
jgi:hypothetical protein